MFAVVSDGGTTGNYSKRRRSVIEALHVTPHLLQAQALEEENAKRAAAEARKAAVNGLAAMAADPVSAWQKAVQLVKMYTSAASVYVANIVDEEQPSWTPPEDPEADVETDDEAEHAAGRHVCIVSLPFLTRQPNRNLYISARKQHSTTYFLETFSSLSQPYCTD